MGGMASIEWLVLAAVVGLIGGIAIGFLVGRPLVRRLRERREGRDVLASLEEEVERAREDPDLVEEARRRVRSSRGWRDGGGSRSG